MSERERRLWSAVLCQAYEDLQSAEFRSYDYNQSQAFFFSPGQEWRESRRDICDFLGLEPRDLQRAALRIINARRLERGLPPLQPRPAHTPTTGSRLPKPRVPAPAAAAKGPLPPLPRLVATFNPEPERRGRRQPGSWRQRWDFNPFAPLPSERSAEAAD